MSLAKKIGAMLLTLAAAAPLFGQSAPTQARKYDGGWVLGTIGNTSLIKEQTYQPFPAPFRTITPGTSIVNLNQALGTRGTVEYRTVTPEGKAVFTYLCARGETLQQETYALAKGESLPLGLSCDWIGDGGKKTPSTLDLRVEQISAGGQVIIYTRILPHNVEAQETKR